MKRRSVLKRQTIKKKGRSRATKMWRLLSIVNAGLIKVFSLVACLALISLLFVGLYGYLIESPFIRLEEIIFSGAGDKIKGELIEKAGLNSDNSLLGLNLNKLKESMDGHPWVRSTRLEKNFPNTLVIKVEKEVPKAIVAAEKLYYMNGWGKPFKELVLTDDFDYPVITGISLGGKEVEKNLKRAAHVINILEDEKGTLSVENLAEVHVEQEGKVSLYFSSIPVVIRLTGRAIVKRMDDLKRVVEHLESTGRIHMVRGIDLNYPDGAVVSFKNG